MALRDRCILVLIRDAEAAHFLVVALQRASADLIVANDTASAIARLKHFQFDAAVVDFEAGEERTNVARQLKQAHLPIVVPSADQAPDHWDARTFATPAAVIPELINCLR